jgi:cephalosporin hydroxylase
MHSKLRSIEHDREAFLEKARNNQDLQKIVADFHSTTAPLKYAHNFDWFGRPIIQLPQDIIVMQELLWDLQPDLIIETGVARGGSLIFYSSILHLLDLANEKMGNDTQAKSEVWGIDIRVHSENKEAIVSHPFADKIRIFEGSSTDPSLAKVVAEEARGFSKVLVCLDSDHAADHVLMELEMYAPLVSVGSYCVVFDSTIEDMPAELFEDREWGPGNSPRSAATRYLEKNSGFTVDRDIDCRLVLTAASGGFLRRDS